ncbi:hypothetical protein D9757_009868 [Collybiopsis confluens]|uniref:HAT C-terminal dimerisation domain-containing protein n=1 Tax=Collybiopsis confluens TaxID=2823264 RepID=A0A8H5CFK4_9AGAR|nr:hypothetical protein D9757_015392 [Collybiopsis confluens]KAF5370964.1 hypothetical protein D9757_009868 [Collybiopsis confluens]
MKFSSGNPLDGIFSKSRVFTSMIPKDTAARKAAKAAATAAQTTIDDHAVPLPPKEYNAPYSHELFEQAALEWLIETDQPIAALEHPKFKHMISIAARTTAGVKIPHRYATRKAIIRLFKKNLYELRVRFAHPWSDIVTGKISVTCDAWQASNGDAYFAVTGHWIEEASSGSWMLKSALLGFTQMNTAHTILRTQSKSKHYDPTAPDDHEPDVEACIRDEIGLARSSAKRAQLFKDIQRRDMEVAGEAVHQLLLDMAVRWSSTYVMLHRVQELKAFIPTFIYKIGMAEKDIHKRRAIDKLNLSDEEWERVDAMLGILAHADHAQQAFSSENEPCLHIGLPALEALHHAWSKQLLKEKYSLFTDALNAGISKISEYYDRTGNSSAYCYTRSRKQLTLKKHWDAPLRRKFKERYTQMYGSTTAFPHASKSRSSQPLGKKSSLLRELSDDEDQSLSHRPQTQAPWLDEFSRYYDTQDTVSDGMSIVQWWGLNAQRLPVWAALARDFLAIMASSVSSERAFSAAGITISKRRNRLKGDIVEALQFLKSLLRKDLLFRESISAIEEFKLEVEDSEEGCAADADRSVLLENDPLWVPLDDGSEEWEDVCSI